MFGRTTIKNTLTVLQVIVLLPAVAALALAFVAVFAYAVALGLVFRLVASLAGVRR